MLSAPLTHSMLVILVSKLVILKAAQSAGDCISGETLDNIKVLVTSKG